MNNNIDKLRVQYNRYKELLEYAKKHLNDEKNVNHKLYEEYKKEENNPKNNSKPQCFKQKFSRPTNIQNINLCTEIKITEYEKERVDVKKITDKEKNTTIKIFGTKLQEKGGEHILKVLEKFNMGHEEGQSMYDIVYIPIFKPDNNNKYFVINFRKSSYIKDFNDAIIDYLSKNEPNHNYEIYWYEKQGEKFKKYLEDKLKKKQNYKGFIKYL